MAGPGIRYWEMAHALSKRLTVGLATPGSSLAGEGFESYAYSKGAWGSIAPLIAESDVLLLTGDLLIVFPQLATCGKPLVIEATYPYTFEVLQLKSGFSRDQQMTSFLSRLEVVRRAALAGDFFFCATQRQRDYWLGVLDAFGRINPDTYSADPTLYQLIDIVPFGLPSRQIVSAEPVVKGVLQGISREDKVLLWGGGLWEWLDSLSLVRAVARISEERSDVRLLFPGTRHPNPSVPDMPMCGRTMDLSDRLGLTDKVVFFGDWVPYEQWSNYLHEADIGVSLHFDALETRFAFRTRVLDYIWAGLPMIVTEGDATSELVARQGLGVVVPPGDDEAIADAIVRLLDTAELEELYRERFEQVRANFTWERVCEPIARFCEHPCFAPDREVGMVPARNLDYGHILTAEQEAEIARLHALVDGYERGCFIRLMRWLGEWRKRIWRGG